MLRNPGRLFVSATLVAALSGAAASADVVTDWNQMALDAIASSATPPPRASRALAMMHTAIYDTVNAVDGTHQIYRVNMGNQAGASREAGAIMAAHHVLSNMFPAQAATFAAARDTRLASIPDGASKTAGMALGQAVATQILDWRATDGSTNPSTYTPTIAPGRWRQAPGVVAPGLLPQWGSMTPFAMNNGSQFRGGPPPALNSPEYAAAVNLTKELGSATSVTRTQTQTDIARVWAGGAGTPTPPGQWNQIAQQIAQSRGNSLSENARMFAMLNVTMADAAIACWDMKYEYDLWRPITAIREADTDGNDATVADPNWTPLISTPNFPEYTSGHSTFSRGAATILQAFLGTDAVSFSLTAADAPGIMRSFTSLDAAADEAGMSRIYGGIHFSFANIEGQLCGDLVADWVAANYFAAIPAPGASGLLAMAGLIAVRRRR